MVTDNDDEIVPENEEVPGFSFAKFLESVPPGRRCKIDDLFEKKSPSFNAPPRPHLKTPNIRLVCDHEHCGGVRTFRYSSGNRDFQAATAIDTFMNYRCGNCSSSLKKFALHANIDGAERYEGQLIKYGESPPFGPPTPTRFLRLFEKDRGIFLKGRRCESQGLGIGAFTYYRRVVENRKNQIFDEIIRVSKKISADEALIDDLEKAKDEIQFSKAVESIRSALPPILLINGQNPLTLLHGALSQGVHDLSDEKCLELAHDVRIVLAEFAERINTAVRDEAELNDAVNRLVRSRTGK